MEASTAVKPSMRNILKLVNEKLVSRLLPEISPVVVENEDGGVMELPELFLLFEDRDGWYFSRNLEGDPSKQIMLSIILASIIPDLIFGTEYTLVDGQVIWKIDSSLIGNLSTE